MYLYQQLDWPHFTWDNDSLLVLLSSVRHKQGRLKGYMDALGFALRKEATLQTLTQDVLKSSEIEGEMLNLDQVRSSLARKLGMDIAGLVPAERHVDGVVEMMLDATRNAQKKLDTERLFGWHSALFPSGRSGMHKIVVGNWRDNEKGPMQVISGAMGKEKVHFEAPDSSQLKKEMRLFFNWFNSEKKLDPVIKSAIAHLWFLTVHPFDDGNGRIARAIADMQLARADGDEQRFYSMSAQIRLDRTAYYAMLEKTQKGTLDITAWLLWYLNCLDRALNATDGSLKKVMGKTQFWDKHQKTGINERQRLMINKLFEGFNGNLTSTKWAKIAKCSTDTALRDVNDLIKKKILKKEEGGGRSTSYILKP
ncbi:cell filamentation protein Fic [Sphingobacteriaceae bacterium]|nr:cell filamentation protein Fic [Sphingobacteriaceae bacterium]